MRSGARQGLNANSIGAEYFEPTLTGYGRLLGGWTWQTLMKEQSFTDMILGVYPSFKDCVDNLIPSSSIAFHRDFCVLMDKDGLIWLYRQKERIGLVQVDGDKQDLILFKRKSYLREEIQENGTMPHITSEI